MPALSKYVRREQVRLSTGKLASIPDWLSASYIPKIRELTSKTTMRLPEHFVGFPELLSDHIYGSQEYWRVLLIFNGIENWFTGMKPGMLIRIPELNEIEALKNASAVSRIGQTVTI